MTAAERAAEKPHPLRRGASPAVIRQWLLPEDRARFAAAYERAIDEARASYDLTTVHDVVEYWRRMALMQTDPAAFRRTVRRVAELATGAARPENEPFGETRSKAGI